MFGEYVMLEYVCSRIYYALGAGYTCSKFDKLFSGYLVIL
jgi:hypothetical protein